MACEAQQRPASTCAPHGMGSTPSLSRLPGAGDALSAAWEGNHDDLLHWIGAYGYRHARVAIAESPLNEGAYGVWR